MDWRVTRTDTESAVLMLDCPGLCWDTFPALAEALLQDWELRLLDREWGADRHGWLLEFEGSQLRLEYEHHSGCWLTAVQPVDREVLFWLGCQHNKG
ncbi:DUF3630 family protein [Aeromonas popoffii]|jgi:Protein of unknown function (DUF3630)|uniref:DUF3630 family protein n=1 Tax=Aeromonas popoffii TaxID=70856 RepID=UPI0030CCB3EA